jgi:hypothetical protein
MGTSRPVQGADAAFGGGLPTVAGMLPFGSYSRYAIHTRTARCGLNVRIDCAAPGPCCVMALRCSRMRARADAVAPPRKSKAARPVLWRPDTSH